MLQMILLAVVDCSRVNNCFHVSDACFGCFNFDVDTAVVVSIIPGGIVDGVS